VVKVLDLKMKKTNLGKYFDACITSFDLGYPKEDPEFFQDKTDLGFFQGHPPIFDGVNCNPRMSRPSKPFPVFDAILRARGRLSLSTTPHGI
jgi:hypothetical protein